MLTPAELVWLLAAVAKGDEAAFARLYAATRAKLYGVVLRILRREDHADEMMQETYLQLWRTAGQFDPGRTTPIVWMVAIARRGALDRLRRESDAPHDGDALEIQEATDEAPQPVVQRPFGEELKRLFACMGRLPPEQQRLLLLAYYNGSSRDQLAAQFECPLSTVQSWLRSGLLEIRKCLAHD